MALYEDGDRMTGNSHRIENNIPSGLETSASTVAPIDSTDAIIVDILEHDGRATLTKLAKASGLFPLCNPEFKSSSAKES